MHAVRFRLVLALPFIFVIPLAVLHASAPPHMDSRWRTADITVDGRQDDWPSSLMPLGDQPLSIDAVNDGSFLYLRLATSDPGARQQILREGLLVWFDGAGGTKKRLGIKYPFVQHGSGGADDNEHGGRGGYGGGRRPHGGTESGDKPDPDTYEPPEALEVLGPGKDDARMLVRDHAQGIEVALRMDHGTAVYELKVPLAKNSDHPYAVDAAAGQTIGVGFETEKLQSHSEGGRHGGGGGGGHGGGGYGGGRGHGGGMGGYPRGGSGGGEREAQPPKPIKAWLTLKLAAPA